MFDEPKEPRRKKSRFGLWIFVFVFAAPLGLAGYYYYERDSEPESLPGPNAEADWNRLATYANLDAWRDTAVVRFTVNGEREYVWDRRREFVRLRWADTIVWMRLRGRTGYARVSGEEVPAFDNRGLVEQAYRFWARDSLLVNPVAKMARSSVTHEAVGPGRLKIILEMRGKTFLWSVRPDGKPQSFRFWADDDWLSSGLEWKIADWDALRTGAKIPTRYETFGRTFEITGIAGATSIEELFPDVDPFTRLAPATDSFD